MKHLTTLALLAALAACQGPDPARSAADRDWPIDAAFAPGPVDLIVDPDPVAARGGTFASVPRVVDPFPWPDRVQELRPEFIDEPVVPASPDAPDLFDAIVDPDPVASRGWR